MHKIANAEPSDPPGYSDALKHAAECASFEAALPASSSAASVDDLAHFVAYIDFEKRSRNPPRIRAIYERALLHCCLSPQLWLGYADYLHAELKDVAATLVLARRAVRNCPWAGALWVVLLRALEQRAPSELDGAFARARASALGSADEMSDVALQYVGAVWREASAADGVASAAASVRFRAAADLAIEWLAAAAAEPPVTLFAAAVELRHLGNAERALALIEPLIKAHARDATVWADAIALVMPRVDECRTLYKRAVVAVSDASRIGREWVRFECEFGKLENVEFAQRKCALALEAMRQRTLAEEQRQQEIEQRAEQQRQLEAERAAMAEQARKEKRREKRVAKKQDHKEVKGTAPKQANKPRAAEARHGKRPAELETSSVPPPKKARLDEPADAEMHGDEDDHEGESSETGGEASEEESAAVRHTAYLSGVPAAVTPEQIMQAFGAEATAVRIVTDVETQTPKGFAYIDFATLSGSLRP